MPKDADTYNPKALKPTDERANYLQKFILKDKNTTIHLNRLINPFTLSILPQCSPFLQAHSVGNPILLMGNLQRVNLVPSESLIFEQPLHPRNLGDPLAITYTNLKNRHALPSEKEFSKAEYVIG